MRLQYLPVAALAVLCVSPAIAQQSVCDLFKDLKSHDGEQIVVRGELFLDGDRAALGATVCETRYQSRVPGPFVGFQIWPTAIELRPSEKVPNNQRLELKNRAADIKRLVAANRTIAAAGTFLGRLSLPTDGSIPARLIFDDARDITIEPLADASTLPVIPICDLFQDLPKYKDQRIAVRADFVATDERAWLSGRCKGNFITEGYRWPVSLWYGQPDYYGAEPFSLFRIDDRKRFFSPPVAAVPYDPSSLITTVTFAGRLHMRDKYFVQCGPDGRYRGYGFGHLGGTAAELIVEAAFDAKLTPLPSNTEPEPETDCRTPNRAAHPAEP